MMVTGVQRVFSQAGRGGRGCAGTWLCCPGTVCDPVVTGLCHGHAATLSIS